MITDEDLRMTQKCGKVYTQAIAQNWIINQGELFVELTSRQQTQFFKERFSTDIAQTLVSDKSNGLIVLSLVSTSNNCLKEIVARSELDNQEIYMKWTATQMSHL